MTPIAPHLTAFFRERLPLQRGASPHTCESYAYSFQLLLEFASDRLNVTPSKLYLEQLDAALVMEFLAHLEEVRDNGPSRRCETTAPVPAMPAWPRSSPSCALSSIASLRFLNKACASWPFHPRELTSP